MYYATYQDDESSYDEGDDQQDDNLEIVHMTDSKESAQDESNSDGPSPGFAALVSAMIIGWILLGIASLVTR